ncbi:hypothetical protein V2A60_007159 [Cordyceps javanica]|uniref:Cyclin-related 2 n=1 Tax=Cordyceps javanica TaxID=43265 RepID=A0A545USP2_9HYPO|nr:Cyclin-related 2 [Cordyceps javanica]TQW04291.1 Cyclin-related 2 [Cordyceps javanica]
MDAAPAPPSLPTDTSAASSASIHELPPPPVPSSDPNLAVDAAAAGVSGVRSSSSSSDSSGPAPPPATEAPPPPPSAGDLFALPAAEAMRLLGASLELLVRMTGDIPPTPPPRMPTDPQMSGLQAEKESIVRSHSDKNLARLRQQQQQQQQQQQAVTATPPVTGKRSRDEEAHHGGEGKTKLQAYSAAMSATLTGQAGGDAAIVTATAPDGDAGQCQIDGVTLKPHALRPAPAVSSAHAPSPSPYVIVGSDSQPINLQHGAITRKFYSKNEPPISIHQYLQRLHQFCPMSAAVYLAASLYIHRLAVEERAIPVTRRNAHRLVLAGLRVAMKALEDLSYPHGKFARVGGVSETELARLEISFCFLAGFELVVREEALSAHWTALRDGRAARALQGVEVPTLRLDRKPREVTT